MKIAKKYVVCLMVVLTVCSMSIAQVNPALSSALQKALDAEKIRVNAIGISAAVMLPNNELWCGVSGMSNPYTSESITSNMAFGIASITKTFIASIILQMASEGELSLEDKISYWLPPYNNIDEKITIRQLLSHTSGIYNYTDNYSLWSLIGTQRSKKFTPEEILTYIGGKLFDAGTSYKYSNTNFLLLGMIIKKVSGKELSEELHERILTPLGLNHIFLDVEDVITLPIANNWSSSFGTYENNAQYPRTSMSSAAWSAGGMFSTAEDLVRWIKRLFDGEVMTAEYFEQMRAFTPTSNYYYGLGLNQVNGLYGKILGHAGGLPGYSSYVGYSPSANAYVAVLLNKDINPYSFADALIGAVINYNKQTSAKNVQSLPGKIELGQNYPNPFNPSTNIEYYLPCACKVSLKIYDMIGREVANVVNEYMPAGRHVVKISADYLHLTSGIYLYKLNAGDFISSKKMILIK